MIAGRGPYDPPPVTDAPYEALLLDIDGTLLDERNRIRPAVRARLRRLAESGVVVMLVTGRSELGLLPVMEDLGIRERAVVYNGAGVWCPEEERLVEERLLSDRSTRRTLAHAREQGLLTLVQCAGAKYFSAPRGEVEERATRGLEGVHFRDGWDLPDEWVIRISVYSQEFPDSQAFCDSIEAAIAQPVYTTNFPLNALADHRESPLQVVDVHPPCRGKAEALRVLRDGRGIDPARVVAVGDASNDVPMLRAAGLGVAVGSGMAQAREAANRVIGSNDTDAIAELVDELWPA